MITCTIKDLLDCGEAELRTGPHGSLLHAGEKSKTGTPIIHVRNIGFGDIREEKPEFVPPEVVSRLPEHLVQTGDILFGRKSAVDRHAFITEKHDGWFQGSDCVRLRLKSSSILPKFLSYYFLTNHHKQWMISQCSHGEVMESLNHAIISRIPLSIPPVHVQQEVVDLLSDYDELIETNRKRLKVLNEIVRSLYQEWFTCLRFPEYEQVTLIESELGLIPEGWLVQKLEVVADINKTTLKKKTAPQVIHYVDVSSVSTGRIDRVEAIAFSESSSRARRVVRQGDTIWSTVRPNKRIHSLVFAEELVVSTAFATISPKFLPYSYLYCALTTDKFVDSLIRSATGSAYPAVTTECFINALILVPPSEVVEKFHAIAQDIFAQGNCIHEQIQNVCRSRELLLHKLLCDHSKGLARLMSP
jgi:type I restriction enzyme S subunit